jgi:hypothetical protein
MIGLIHQLVLLVSCITHIWGYVQVAPSLRRSFLSVRDNGRLSASSAEQSQKIPGTAKMDKDWAQLGFEFRQTKSNARIVYKNGAWGDIQLVEVRLPMKHGTLIPRKFTSFSLALLTGLFHFTLHRSYSITLWSSMLRRVKSFCSQGSFRTFIPTL